MSQPPRELFTAERPVRSDFSRERSYARRRLATIGIIALVTGGVGYGLWGHSGPTNPADIPTIKAEGGYRQKPADPGGIDIPHQDVHVYDELEGKNAPPMPAEHLLPPPENPVAASPTVSAPQQAAIPPVAEDHPPVAPATTEQIAPGPPAEIDEVRKPAKLLATTVAPTVAASPRVTDTQTSQSVAVPTPPAKAVPQSPPRSPIMTLDQIIASTKASAGDKEMSRDERARIAASSPLVTEVLPTPIKKVDSPLARMPPVASTASSPVAAAHPASGNSAIQLASVPNEASANAMMAELQKKYASTLSGIPLHLVRADLGAKGIYYRIQSQGVSTDVATRLCASFKQMNAGCILVRK